MKFMRKNGGFTLVELIVVIAILAILAGVAVPAYSGYIAKAETAADLQLLGAVNDAFAGSVVASRMDMANVNAANLTWNGKSVVGVASVNSGANAKVNESFTMLFAGNETTQFKRIESLVFDAAKKVFVDPATASSITVNYKGSNIVLSGGALQDLKGSSFGTIGSDVLLDKINNVTNIAATMAGSLDAVFNDPAFLQCAMQAVGAADATEYNKKIEEMVVQMMDKDPNLTRSEAMNKLSANAAVLYASQNAVNFTDDQLNNLFSNTGSADIKNNLKNPGKTSEGMAQAALVYGMYTAYANSAEYGSDDLRTKAENPLTVLNALEDDENFVKFVNSEQGKSDMSAYMSSLGIIVDSANNSQDAVSDIIVNGYNNDTLKDLMGGLIG